jgi:hypothetical protein
MQSPVYQADAYVMKRIATPMIGDVVTSAMMELLIYPVNYVIWRKRELGFMNNVKLQTRQLPIVRRLLLRNLLGAGSSLFFWFAAFAFAFFCVACLLVAFGDLSPMNRTLRSAATSVNSAAGKVPDGLPHRFPVRSTKEVVTRARSHLVACTMPVTDVR